MLTLAFDRHASEQTAQVGGKGASLARLSALEANVPPGFVVTTHAYVAYLHANRIDLDSAAAREQIERGKFPLDLAQEIAERMAQLPGDYFAVRSSSVSEDSADKSYAGLFESCLNVTRDAILDAVRHCYASTLAERVLCYREAAEPIAVVVQCMVESRLSGVLFTTHPLDQDRSLMLVEACAGLGEPLVSGEITPDQCLLDRHSGTLIERHTHVQSHKLVRVDGENQRLALDGSEARIDTRQLRELAAYARHIERHSGAPCDIEWCIDSAVRIVQSRPITTPPSLSESTPRSDYHKRFSARVLSPVFEEANVKGYRDDAQAQFELPFSLAGYHLYQPSVQHPLGEVDIWIDDALDRRLKRFMKGALRRDPRYLERLEQRYVALVEAYTDFTESVAEKRFEELSTEALCAWLARFDRLNQRMTSIYNAPIFVLGALGELLREEMLALQPQQGESDFITLTLDSLQNPAHQRRLDLNQITLTLQLGHRVSILAPELLEDAELRGLLEAYHARWRFLGCTDVIGDPHPFAHTLELVETALKQDALAEHAALAQATAEEQQRFARAVARYPELGYELAWMHKWLYHRNITTEHYYRDFQHLRPLWEAVAARLCVSYRQLLCLSVEEMGRALRGELEGVGSIAVARLREGFSCLQQGDAVILKSGIEPEERIESRVLGGDELSGQIANPGIARGRVRVIRDPLAQAARFADGDVLVTSMTTPSFLPLMYRAAAIVTDEGGILCHAALVSREIGKPCLIAVANATQILRDGAEVEVDARLGVVRLLDPSATDSGELTA